MKRKRKESISVFILLSLVIHLLICLYLLIKPSQSMQKKVTKIEVEYVSPPPPPKPAEKKLAEAAPPPPKVTVQDQVVEQQKQINDEKDNNARFLSAFNQRVLQQTRAMHSGQFKNQAKSGQPDEGKKDGDKKKEKVSEKAKEKKPDNPEKGDLPNLKDLSPKFALNTGPKSPTKEDVGDPSQTDDYLKDVQSGLQTMLSTREFVYYSYYNRIKEALRAHWEPNVKEKVKIIYRTGRNVASAKDRVTQVLVTLDAKGELIKVEVIGQSGLEGLDAAAVEAFKAAAPFPNPPSGMVETDGTIRIRWDFVLEV